MIKHSILLVIIFTSLLSSSCIKRNKNGRAEPKLRGDEAELRGKVKSVEEFRYNLFVNDNGIDTQLLYIHHISKYNIKGKKTEMTWISTLNNKDITQRDYFKYDDKGNMIKKSRYNYRVNNKIDSNHWEHTYKYDNNGNLIEKNSNKPYYYDNPIKKETYKYNWRGRKTEENWYGFDSLRLLYTFKFDKNGNSVETIRYVEGEQSKSKTKLDKKGNAIELNAYNDDGNVYFKITYKYDKYDNVTEKSEYYLDRSYWKKTTDKYEYKYDNMGNWIEMSSEHEHDEGTSYQIVERKIEYYP